MTEVITLSQFLTTANTQFQVYDMGRRVQPIDLVAFHQIESLATPYPYPIQGHAQLALVFWRQTQTPYIWFLKLPLDEQGLLAPAPRSQFIRMVLEALGQDLTQQLSQEQQERLAANPFNFTPSQEKLALFNALVRKQLGQQASPQYEFAVQYLSGQVPASDWQHLGLQGLADVCVRRDEPDHSGHIMTGLKLAAPEVQIALCQCLEHLELDASLAQKIAAGFELAPPQNKLYYLRALASRPELARVAITSLVEQARLDADALIAIAARNWTALEDNACRLNYLEALALQPQGFFNQIFADIVAIPGLRTQLLTDIRNPERSSQLSNAIGGLFKATTA
ncbi:DUF3549 family protein [Shewanella salipaludis]|uniref:DUF3549 family protein n=1 Tax=Shewanella salipaludis TaxID=2723052 RepID=A0A972G511_9GAMM|nr:DUF3549 family protein [Shewanella salipaludis]NMH64575.1 DUF3549 family protein [Shewanella salipaludis]